MKKITLYSPGLASYNIGDKIIADSAKREMQPLLSKAFVTEIPTHTPHSWYYMRPLIKNDYKFVLGSNLLKPTFFGFKRQWDITLFKSWITGPCILIGAGWWQYGVKPNFYTKLLYKKVLDSNYFHSVRDEYTKKMLEEAGFKNVINTACPTMWSLTKEHCESIKTSKSNNVIVTLTDYNKDIVSDKKLMSLLSDKYDEVYYWPQGIGDYEYFNELNIERDNVKIIAPSLESFDEMLSSGNVDYIGTRLHGGVRALQKKVRTLILAIDNRAWEKKKDFNLPVVERNDEVAISNFINNDYKVDVKIPIDSINRWKKQFETC
ncbi:polysaccharide pyruvyl transferase family protein [Vibrio parahaemolyticus]|nr:polysaccharide pyruvyl transferase family protein [Vibrio parahaemolyticus]